MILDRMKESYISYAGFEPQEQSDIMIRLRVLAVKIVYKSNGGIYALAPGQPDVKRSVYPAFGVDEEPSQHRTPAADRRRRLRGDLFSDSRGEILHFSGISGTVRISHSGRIPNSDSSLS